MRWCNDRGLFPLRRKRTACNEDFGLGRSFILLRLSCNDIESGNIQLCLSSGVKGAFRAPPTPWQLAEEERKILLGGALHYRFGYSSFHLGCQATSSRQAASCFIRLEHVPIVRDCATAHLDPSTFLSRDINREEEVSWADLLLTSISTGRCGSEMNSTRTKCGIAMAS